MLTLRHCQYPKYRSHRLQSARQLGRLKTEVLDYCISTLNTLDENHYFNDFSKLNRKKVFAIKYNKWGALRAQVFAMISDKI